MKFLCSNCKAKYQISDEKVAGRTLRMTCRKCREEIVIRGEPATPPPAAAYAARPLAHPIQAPQPAVAPSALSANWDARVAGGAPSYGDAAPLNEWHLGINDVPVGPMRREEVARKMAAGAVGPGSLAWREGLDDWMPISQIPELAVLLPGAGRASAPPPPPAPPITQGSVAQRMDAVPLGGRAGATAFGSDEWQVPAEAASSPSQVVRNPLLDGAAAPAATPATRSGGPPFGIVFAVLAFALLMTVIAIVGAGWLRGGEPRETVATANTESKDEPPAGPHIELDPADLEEEGAEPEAAQEEGKDAPQPSKARKSQASAGAKKTVSGNKKELTAKQKAMLERMGDSAGAKTASLKPRDSQGGGSSKAGRGELTATQLSKVVVRGKRNLQRCYETAAKGSGRDDTIRMDVEVSVSPSGNVTKVRATGQGLPGMDRCIERTVRMWRFPASSDGAQTRFPIVFSAGG